MRSRNDRTKERVIVSDVLDEVLDYIPDDILDDILDDLAPKVTSLLRDQVHDAPEQPRTERVGDTHFTRFKVPNPVEIVAGSCEDPLRRSLI